MTGASRACNVVTARPATSASPTISASRRSSCVRTRAIRMSIERGDHSRREQLNDVARLAEIRRHQRVGGRHRAVRNTGPHGRKAEHEMLDAIARQNQDRPLLREVPAREPGRDAPHAIEHFGVADVAAIHRLRLVERPAPASGATRRPVLEEVHEPRRILGQQRPAAAAEWCRRSAARTACGTDRRPTAARPCDRSRQISM